MGFRNKNLIVPAGTDGLIASLVHQRLGVFFENGKGELLLEKLAPLVIERGFNSYLEYYYLLKYDEAQSAEWQNVMNAVSVQETYFWREFDQIKALVETILPEFLKSGAVGPFRIWSAACATGEEPLSIAMALNEGGWFERAPIEIVASDASSTAIDSAKRGAYRERSFRNLPTSLRDRYFVQNVGSASWTIRPDIHERVRWGIANLVDEPQIAHFASANVIFCRNVFIYFSEKTMGQVVRSFGKFLRAPGCLFVGASESLVRLGANFTLTEVDDAFVYVKGDDRAIAER